MGGVDFTAFLVAVGPLALGITKLVDLIRNVADKNDTLPKWVWNVVPIVLGIGYALVTATNFVNLVSGLNPNVTEHLGNVWGQIVTGVALGGVAAFWHEHLDATSMRASAYAAQVPMAVSSST